MSLGRVALPVWMMAWSNPDDQLSEERNLERATRCERMLDALTAFFEAEMSGGRLRPVVRARRARLPAGTHIIVRARPEAAAAPSEALARDLDSAFAQLGDEAVGSR